MSNTAQMSSGLTLAVDGATMAASTSYLQTCSANSTYAHHTLQDVGVTPELVSIGDCDATQEIIIQIINRGTVAVKVGTGTVGPPVTISAGFKVRPGEPFIVRTDGDGLVLATNVASGSGLIEVLACEADAPPA